MRKWRKRKDTNSYLVYLQVFLKDSGFSSQDPYARQGKQGLWDKYYHMPGKSQGQQARPYTELCGCGEVWFESATLRRKQTLDHLLKLSRCTGRTDCMSVYKEIWCWKPFWNELLLIDYTPKKLPSYVSPWETTVLKQWSPLMPMRRTKIGSRLTMRY